MKHNGSTRAGAAWATARNGVLFVAGLSGIAFETFARRPPDYGLLPVFAGMIGLPWFVSQDNRENDDKRPTPKRGSE